MQWPAYVGECPLTHDASAAIEHDGKDCLEVHLDTGLRVIECVVFLKENNGNYNCKT